MKIFADLHIHSKYSRATSPEMEVGILNKWAEIKGINLLGTGDFTHPKYIRELEEALLPAEPGLFRLRNKISEVRFMLTAEISNIFSVRSKVKRTHMLIFAPSFEIVKKINQKLEKRGNIASDGRPILGGHVKDIVKLVLDVSSECFLVPAHAWTPWFSVFGSQSGFDSLEECFEEETKNIYAIETGLSSNPAMNWRLSALDKIALISNSDAHSPSKIGREANVFDCEMDYFEIIDAIKKRDPKRFLYTIEFFPEEGKYHFDGHRNCAVVFSPENSKKENKTCPKCGKPLTIGVMSRVEALADRSENVVKVNKNRIPFKSVIPLNEIISEVLGKGVATKTVKGEYSKMTESLGSELEILLEKGQEEMLPIANSKIVEGIMRMRREKIFIQPGYDGLYGKIKVFETEEKRATLTDKQMSFL